MTFPSEPTSLAETWIALHALDAAARPAGSSDFTSYRLNDDPDSLSAEQLVGRLAIEPKPVGLQFAVQGTVLQVRSRFRPAPPDSPVESGAFRFLAHRYRPPFEDLNVLCVGAGRTLRVTVQDYQQFEHDYLLEFMYTITGDFITPEVAASEGLTPDQTRGAVAMASFAGGSSGGHWTMYADPTPPKFSRN